MERDLLKELATEIKKAHYLLSTLKGKLGGETNISEKEIQQTLAEIEQSLYVVSEEAEAIKRMPKWELALRRAIPLSVTVLISIGTALIVSHFEKTIAQFALLYAFAPLISAVSGNFGLQSTVIITRALAVEGNIGFWKAIVKEVCVALLAGLIVGGLAGTIAYMKTKTFIAFPAIAISLWAGMCTSAIVGAALPIACKKAGIDPALAAGAAETTLQDLISYSTYLLLLTSFHRAGLI